MIRILLGFAAGLVSGGVGMYFYMKNKYDDYADQECEEVRQYYRKKYGLVKPEKGEAEENKDELYDGIVDAIKEYAGREDTESFEKIMAESEHPEDDLISDEELNERRVADINENNNSEPVLITSDDYEAYPYYDKEELTYYTEDDILANENDEIVDDVYSLVGDCLTRTSFIDNSEMVLYVRNGNVSTDFEINKIFGSYSEYHA